MMNATYDSEADAAYITLSKHKVARTVRIDETTLIDIDREGELIGIELLEVRRRNPKTADQFIAQCREIGNHKERNLE